MCLTSRPKKENSYGWPLRVHGFTPGAIVLLLTKKRIENRSPHTFGIREQKPAASVRTPKRIPARSQDTRKELATLLSTPETPKGSPLPHRTCRITNLRNTPTDPVVRQCNSPPKAMQGSCLRNASRFSGGASKTRRMALPRNAKTSTTQIADISHSAPAARSEAFRQENPCRTSSVPPPPNHIGKTTRTGRGSFLFRGLKSREHPPSPPAWGPLSNRARWPTSSGKGAGLKRLATNWSTPVQLACPAAQWGVSIAPPAMRHQYGSGRAGFYQDPLSKKDVHHVIDDHLRSRP